MGIPTVKAKNSIWTVYVHTNKSNKKKYVGITSKPVEKRWLNGRGYRTGKFKLAIKKYGWEDFEHEIIANELTEQQAKLMEIAYIALFDSNSRTNGYNLTKGGDGTLGMKPCLGRIQPAEEIARRSILLMGHYVSKETKEKISKSKIGKIPWMKGKKHKKESIERLKETLKSRDNSLGKNPNAKKVLNIETMEIYDSAKGLSLIIGKSYSHLKSKLNGKYKNNTQYKYLDDYKGDDGLLE